MKITISKIFHNKLFPLVAVVLLIGVTNVVLADDDDDENSNLTPQDALVTTIYDKAVIAGSIRKDANGNMVPGSDGMLSFDYTGDIYSVETNPDTGELKKLEHKIGYIIGSAAFPPEFAYMSGGMRAVMDLLMSVNPSTGVNYTFEEAMGAAGFAGMPPIVPWTCNHCEMKIGETTYVNIVDALDPVNGNPDMIAKYNAMVIGGAPAALESMRLDGRAFMGLTPASFDPVTKTISIRMGGCSAIVGVDGPNAGKLGTLCLNSTATFSVADMDPSSDVLTNGSGISAVGTSNCVTVVHTPTM